jgi:hypothetical protein
MERYPSNDQFEDADHLNAIAPSQTLGHPSEVISDPDLTLNARRS